MGFVNRTAKARNFAERPGEIHPPMSTLDSTPPDRVDEGVGPDRRPLPGGVRTITEVALGDDGPPRYVHAGWADAYPDVVQGVTSRGAGRPIDMGLFGGAPTDEVQGRWATLAEALGVERVVHGRQVHAARVVVHREGPPALSIHPSTDGHVTRQPGVLLTVATADCVPITLLDPSRRVVALLHAGWRGVAAGIVERGIEVVCDRLLSATEDLVVHLGPAICGACYEVGPEVHEALEMERPSRPLPVDLRGVIARRAVEADIPADRITVSSYCTRCGDPPFFSHRAGCTERQLSFVGLKP